MPAQPEELLGPLLRDVSRSFYLTLRVLPAEIRPQISLAYLLARASDTIADTEGVARAERVEILRQMQKLPGGADFIRDRSRLQGAPTNPAEATLLTRVPDCLDLLASFSDADQQLIRELLAIIISGQIFDLERFPGKPLTDTELDHYTYMVAGCVGEFWTKMAQTHLPGVEALSIEDSVRFGKGLQLVNVLRDVAEDRRRGRHYLPDLNDYQRWLDTACDHLDAGWRYTMLIPAGRLRLACVWPIWIGLLTIARLRRANPLDPGSRVKISRGAVYGVMARSWMLGRSDVALNQRYQRLRRAAGLQNV